MTNDSAFLYLLLYVDMLYLASPRVKVPSYYLDVSVLYVVYFVLNDGFPFNSLLTVLRLQGTISMYKFSTSQPIFGAHLVWSLLEIKLLILYL